MDNVQKKVFVITPSAHPNAEEGNDYAVHVWLKHILSEHARRTRPSQLANEFMGTPIAVVVEVIES